MKNLPGLIFAMILFMVVTVLNAVVLASLHLRPDQLFAGIQLSEWLSALIAVVLWHRLDRKEQ